MKYSWTYISVILFALQILFVSDLNAQGDTVVYSIETIDGNEYIGQIISEDDNSIVLKTKSLGKITILKANIRKKILIREDQIKQGQYWLDNPQATRYFWQPNGHGLKEGEGYYQNVWLFINQFSYGVSDNITMGIGFMPAFLFNGAPTPVWFTPKVSIPIVKNQFSLGAGILAGTVLVEDDTGFGIAYGVATVGPRDANISLGVGYGYTSGDWARSPTVTLSGMARVSKKSYLVTENYFIGTGGENNLVFLSFGGRTLLKKIGIDYGLFTVRSSGDGFFALPLLGLTVPFGQAISTVPRNGQ